METGVWNTRVQTTLLMSLIVKELGAVGQELEENVDVEKVF